MFKKIIVCAALGVASAADVCRALAMSGGGSKGAFEAGALYGLYHAKDAGQDFDYDVITGVSAGSINTGAMSVFPKEDTEHMLQVISDTWSHLTTADLY
jgi:predicted acylesterase/phospholipase RssA